jgi:hypothetical protein
MTLILIVLVWMSLIGVNLTVLPLSCTITLVLKDMLDEVSCPHLRCDGLHYGTSCSHCDPLAFDGKPSWTQLSQRDLFSGLARLSFGPVTLATKQELPININNRNKEWPCR